MQKRQVNHETCTEEIWVHLSLYCSLHQCFLWWLSCDASSHFHFWSASLDACYCEWHPRSTSENLSRCMQPQIKSLLDPPFACAWVQSLIYGSYKKYRLQESSNLNTSYFVCCQDVVETSSPEPKDLVSRSARPGASVFREVLSWGKKKRAKTPPKCKPFRD